MIKLWNFKKNADGNSDVGLGVMYSMTPLHYAARYGNAEMVKAILKTSEGEKSLEVKTYDGWTPLLVASRYGNADMVKAILGTEKGKKSLEVKTNNGWTPLHCAACYGNDEMVKAILKHEEAIKSSILKNMEGNTPLNNTSGEMRKLIKAAQKEAYALKKAEKETLKELKKEFISFATNKDAKEKDFAHSNLNKVFDAIVLPANLQTYDVGVLSKFKVYGKNQKKTNNLSGYNATAWEKFKSIFTGKSTKEIQYSKVAQKAIESMMKDPKTKKVIDDMAKAKFKKDQGPRIG